jgi:hypothetical protein
MPSTASVADLNRSLPSDDGVQIDHVRCERHRVTRSDVDLLRNFDRVIDLDAEIPHCAFDLRVPERELDPALFV